MRTFRGFAPADVRMLERVMYRPDRAALVTASAATCSARFQLEEQEADE